MGQRSDRRAARRLLDEARRILMDDGDPADAYRKAGDAYGKALEGGPQAARVQADAISTIDDICQYVQGF